MSDMALPAMILDPILRSVVGTDSVNLVYNKGSWVPLEVAQPASVVAWLSSSPTVDDNCDGTGDRTLVDAPVLATTTFGEGRVVYTTFHTHEQASAEMTAILQYIVFEL